MAVETVTSRLTGCLSGSEGMEGWMEEMKEWRSVEGSVITERYERDEERRESDNTRQDNSRKSNEEVSGRRSK